MTLQDKNFRARLGLSEADREQKESERREREARVAAAMAWLHAREINCPEVHTILALLEGIDR